MNITFNIPISTVVLLWIIIGLWINYKRNWYKDFHENTEGISPGFACTVSFVFAPINLLIVLYEEFINKDWDNNNNNNNNND
ncbi:MAG TPA: hypothetical protein PLC61_10190 [Chitinophagales bacterium]|nr:hypothetical protein [Chitinophagales bacterium]